jgi:hypothetical protein
MSNVGIIGPVQNPVRGDLTTSFTASGNYTSAVGAGTATVLVIAGGGGGAAGGGGAGGFRLLGCHPIPASTVPITIGAGGAGSPAWPCLVSGKGSDSIFATASNPITSTGGGLAGYNNQPSGNPGGPGGSGGGAGGAYFNNTGGPGNSPPTSPSQGNPGGNSSGDAATYSGGGGGGGASTAGTNSSNGGPSTGGAGTDVSPTFGAAPQPFYPVMGSVPKYGPENTFAGGGAGLVYNCSPGQGGAGGGGPGFQPGPSGDSLGRTNRGGGGGAGNSNSGGSGIVILKQPGAGPVQASGVWSLSEAYNYKKAGTWTS